MKSTKLVAVFDSRDAAERARESLTELGLTRERISIADQGSSDRRLATPEAKGTFWMHVKEMFMPEHDRHTLEESMRRGGYVLVATVDDADHDEARARLERAGAVDLEERQAEWRASGWTSRSTTSADATRAGGTSAAATGAAVERTREHRAGAEATGDGTLRDSTLRADDGVASDESGTIPVMEEELRVGKREVNRGSVRVRSYVVEEPVHEEVRLREEHVNVERRPVDSGKRPVAEGSAEGLLQERTIEVSETAEEAVVGKVARVREEVVVSKTADERVEQIDDTVRRTKVDIEDGRGSASRTGRPD